MLLISSAVVPITSANINNIDKDLKKPKIVTDDRPKINVELPDVHVSYPNSRFIWGTVEFDEPGAIIDVDLSDIEEVVSLWRVVAPALLCYCLDSPGIRCL